MAFSGKVPQPGVKIGRNRFRFSFESNLVSSNNFVPTSTYFITLHIFREFDPKRGIRPEAGDEAKPEDKQDADKPRDEPDAGGDARPDAVDEHDQGSAGWGKTGEGEHDALSFCSGDDHAVNRLIA